MARALIRPLVTHKLMIMVQAVKNIFDTINRSSSQYVDTITHAHRFTLYPSFINNINLNIFRFNKQPNIWSYLISGKKLLGLLTLEMNIPHLCSAPPLKLNPSCQTKKVLYENVKSQQYKTENTKYNCTNLSTK